MNAGAYLRGHIGGLIDEHGFAVVAVGQGDEPGSAFMYTIGLSNQGLPEIILVGVASEALKSIINDLVARWKADEAPWIGQHGELATMQDGTKLLMETVFVETDHALLKYMKQRFNVEEKLKPPYPFETVQLLWPDTKNKLPTDEGYDSVRFPQPLLPRV